MRRGLTLVETVAAVALGLLVIGLALYLMRMANRVAMASMFSMSTAQAGSLLVERLIADLEAALPSPSWSPGPTPPAFLEREDEHRPGGARYGRGVEFRRSPSRSGRGAPSAPMPVGYSFDPIRRVVERRSGTERDVFQPVDLFVVSPYEIGSPARRLYRIILRASPDDRTGAVPTRALPLTTSVCPRFLRYHQALPFWVWPKGEWEARLGS